MLIFCILHLAPPPARPLGPRAERIRYRYETIVARSARSSTLLTGRNSSRRAINDRVRVLTGDGVRVRDRDDVVGGSFLMVGFGGGSFVPSCYDLGTLAVSQEPGVVTFAQTASAAQQRRSRRADEIVVARVCPSLYLQTCKSTYLCTRERRRINLRISARAHGISLGPTVGRGLAIAVRSPLGTPAQIGKKSLFPRRYPGTLLHSSP